MQWHYNFVHSYHDESDILKEIDVLTKMNLKINFEKTKFACILF